MQTRKKHTPAEATLSRLRSDGFLSFLIRIFRSKRSSFIASDFVSTILGPCCSRIRNELFTMSNTSRFARAHHADHREQSFYNRLIELLFSIVFAPFSDGTLPMFRSSFSHYCCKVLRSLLYENNTIYTLHIGPQSNHNIHGPSHSLLLQFYRPLSLFSVSVVASLKLCLFLHVTFNHSKNLIAFLYINQNSFRFKFLPLSRPASPAT